MKCCFCWWVVVLIQLFMATENEILLHLNFQDENFCRFLSPLHRSTIYTTENTYIYHNEQKQGIINYSYPFQQRANRKDEAYPFLCSTVFNVSFSSDDITLIVRLSRSTEAICLHADYQLNSQE